jgi:hypothetical protein
MAAYVYNCAKNNIDISDLRILLLVGYTFNADHDDVAEIIAAATKECDFTNYARKALTGEAFTVNNTSDLGKLDADDPSTWTSAGGATNNTISHAVIYQYNASDASAVPVTCHTVSKTTDGSDLVIAIGSAGILTTS